MGAVTGRLPGVEELRAVGLAAGLDVLEVADAAPFPEVRAVLEQRKEAGLHGGMQFTFRRPERSTDPAASLTGASSLVVGARSYLVDDDALAPGAVSIAPRPRGRIARYAWEDHYAHLTAGLTAVSEVLRAAGWRSRVVADDNALVDRAAAHRAGIGWWGKNANLLLPRLGSWYVLGSVITDAPLEPTAPLVDDLCGTCRRCLDGCPTGAIPEPGVIDARRCLSWLLQDTGPFPLELRVALGDRIYGCDECQEVCPPNRRAPRRAASGAERPWAPLVALLDPDDALVLAWADRWYIPQRDVRYVRRNALVVLGNIGDASDPEVEHLVRTHLAHPDALLRGHAVWAARRLGREDLLQSLTGADDPLVQAELAAAAIAR